MGGLKYGVCAVILASALAILPARAEEPPSGADFVNVFNKIFGAHAGFRANHAKGIVVEGTFTPTQEAAGVSKAAHFAGPAVPVTVRFSDAGGVPNIPDTDPNSMPKGMAIKFNLADGSETDIVCISFNGFPASTPREFLDFLTAISQSGPEAPKPTPLEQFVGAHPATAYFVTTMPPPPVSYATQPFFGVNAFRFTNAAGESKYGRYFIKPAAGEAHLEAGKAAERGPNYLAEELAGRLNGSPAAFQLFVQLAEEGDAITDGTKLWPESRPMVLLGTVTVTKLAADSDTLQRELLFTPVNLIDGIEASDDPMIEARGNAYAESFARRSQ